jgi:hypothetical protein
MNEYIGCLLKGLWNGIAIYGLFILSTQIYWYLTYKLCLF